MFIDAQVICFAKTTRMSLQFSCCATWLALIQKDLTILDKLVNFQRLLSLLSMRNLKSNQTIAQTLNSIQLFNTYKIQKIPLAFCITKNKLPPSSSRKFFRCSPILAWPKLPLPISSPKSKTSKTVSFDWWGWGVGWDESKKCNKRFFAGQWRADTVVVAVLVLVVLVVVVVSGIVPFGSIAASLKKWKNTSRVERGEHVHLKDAIIQHFWRFNESLWSHPSIPRVSHNQQKKRTTL